MAKLKDLQEGLEEIRKQYGTASVFLPNDSFKSNIQSISTGSFNLNDAIGIGGIPSGRLIMLSGVESSGKSLLALSCIKEAQRDGGVGYYIDGEYTFDPEWTQRLGVDVDRILVSQTNNAQEAFEILVGKPAIKGKREKPIPGILSNDKILRAGLKVIVIDSIDSLQTPMEAESEVGKSNMALMARFLPPELRRLTPMLSKTGVSIIAIMQARSVPGQIYGDALTVSGGRALKHAASVWIDLGVAWKSAVTIDGTKDGEKIGHSIIAKIRKNKVAPPFKEAQFAILFQKGIDLRPEIPEQAVNTGVVKKESERIYTYKSALGEFKWNGLNNVISDLTENKELLKEIAVKVKEAKKKEDEERLANTNFTESEDEKVNPEAVGLQEESTESVEHQEIEEGTEPQSTSEEKKVESSQKSSDSTEKTKDTLNDDYENMTLTELKNKAKELNVPNLYKITSKSKLIEAIEAKKKEDET